MNMMEHATGFSSLHGSHTGDNKVSLKERKEDV